MDIKTYLKLNAKEKLNSLLQVKNKTITVKAVIVAAAFIIGYGAYFLTGTKDGVIEQGAEAALRTQGIEVDFSPE